MSIVVVLPAPFGPRKATISPGSTVRSMPWTASTAPKLWCTSAQQETAGMLVLSRPSRALGGCTRASAPCGPSGDRPDRRPRRGRRLPRPQRRRQDHHHRHAARAWPARLAATVEVYGVAAPARSRAAGSSAVHADRGPAEGPHRRARPSSSPRPVRPPPARRRGARARRHRRHRRPHGRQVLRRPAAAAAVRDGAAARPRADDPRRADHRDGRRGPPGLLGRHPPGRRAGPHRPLRHALPRGGRRLRRPDRARSARAGSSPTAPPPRSRPWPPAAPCGPRSPAPTRSRWPRLPGVDTVEVRGDTVLCTPRDSDAVARHLLDPHRRPRPRDHLAQPRGRVHRPDRRRRDPEGAHA